MSGLRVLLVDDLLMVIEAIAYHLSSLPDFEVVGCYQVNNPQMVADVGGLAPDVIVVDLEQVIESDTDLLEALALVVPAANVIVLTSNDDRTLALEAEAASSASWFDKRGSLTELVDALRLARRPVTYPPRHLGTVLRGLRADAPAAAVGSCDCSV